MMLRTIPFAIGLGFALLVSGIAAQETMLLAPQVDGLWRDAGGAVRVQVGHEVFRVAGRDAGSVLAPPHRLPVGTKFFDLDDGFVHLIDARAETDRLGRRTTHPWMDPTTLPFRGAPCRLPLLARPDAVLLPEPDGLLAVSAQGEEAPTLLAWKPRSHYDSGYGFGYEAQVETVLPWVLPFRTGAGVDLILGGQHGFVRYDVQGRGQRLEVDFKDTEEGILGFPWEVAPLVGDLNGDSADDLVVFDPSAGVVAVYGELAKGEAKPTRMIVLKRPILAAWAANLDGKPGADLAVLVADVSGLLGQLQVLQSGKLASELLLYSGSSVGKGGLSRSPVRRRVAPAFSVRIENDRREGRLHDVVAPITGARVLHLRAGGDATVRGFAEGEPRLLKDVAPAGEPVDPFPGVRDAEGRLFLRWKSGAATRVMRW